MMKNLTYVMTHLLASLSGNMMDMEQRVEFTQRLAAGIFSVTHDDPNAEVSIALKPQVMDGKRFEGATRQTEKSFGKAEEKG